MRHLIDTYIEAEEAHEISPFEGLTLLEIIEKTGIEQAIDQLPDGLKASHNTVLKTIENNLRSKVDGSKHNDPAFYEKMSQQLQELIDSRKAKALRYEDYLKEIAELAKKVQSGASDDYAPELNTSGKRALFNNIYLAQENSEPDEAAKEEAMSLALQLDEVVIRERPDDWRGYEPKERAVKAAMFSVLQDEGEVERLFPIIKEHRVEY